MKNPNFISTVLVLALLTLFAGCANELRPYQIEEPQPTPHVEVVIDFNTLIDAIAAIGTGVEREAGTDVTNQENETSQNSVTNQEEIDFIVNRLINNIDDEVWAKVLEKEMSSKEEKAKIRDADPEAYEAMWIQGFAISVRASLSQYTEEEQDTIIERTAKPLYDSFVKFLTAE